MHKLFFVFLMLLGVFGFTSSKAQIAPLNNGIFFQAVARDNFSNPAKDRTVFVEASIIQNAANGTKVLTEFFQTTTDGLGVFSLNIGSGTRIGGTLSGFDKIDWANGPYFLGLKIAIKPLSPVTNWDYTKELIDLGASLFGTVPYSFYSAAAATVKDQVKTSDTAAMLLSYAKKTDLALKVNLADSTTIYVTPSQLRAVKFDTTSIYAVLNQKEILANKSTNVATDATSDTKYPSVRAVKSYVDLQFSNFIIADGSVTTAKLANGSVTDTKIVSVAGSKVIGDIAGNAATATLAANATKLATPRTINGIAFDGSSNITIATGSNPIDADANTKGVVQLTGDLTGTATQPRIANGAVTNAKIADVAASKITGVVAVANGGTGAITAAGARTNLGLVIGTDILAQRTFGSAANNSTTDFIAATDKGANNGVATLGNDGKIPSTQIPAISFQSASVVANQAAMLALANQQVGSIAIRTDNNKNYVLSALPSTTLANWVELATPTSVTSVNGNAGPNVVLTAADIAGVEIASNKSNDIAADAASTTKFPTVKSIKDYVDQQSANAGVADNSITSAKINGAIAIAKGGTGATTAAGARINLGLVIGTDVMSATATTTLTGDVTGSGNGSFATTVNSVGGVSSSTITTLPTRINANTASITAEVTRATNAEAALDTRITSNTASITSNTASITTNTNNISSLTTSVNANTASITAEITRSTNAEAALDTRVTSNTASITTNTNNISSLTTSVNANTASITAEVTRATNAEAALDTRITSNTASITSNTASITANTNNISSLTTSVNANTASITAEVTRATNAEAALDTRVTTNTTSITTNTADILLKAAINSPTFTGTPTAPTPATSDNSTKVATTEYVKNSITAASAGLSTIGAISATPNTRGATISGTTELILTPADATNGGVVTTGAQTFAGAKTFTNTVTFGKDITVSGLTIGGSTTYGNTALGYIALNNVQAASFNAGSWNTAVGHASMYENTTGNFNTAIGRSSLTKNTTGSYNTTVGFHSGSSLRTISTAFPTENTFIGNSSGAGITTGSYNTILGSQTYSIVSGAQVGIGITTGSNNTIIGGRIFGLAPTLSNNVILADGAGNIRAQHDGTAGWNLGTIASGTWSGTTISVAKGGTGLTSPGASGNVLTSDGTNWVSSALPVSGVSTLAYSTTGSSNGGTISGTTLTLAAADGTNPGLISIGTQTFNGAKTFNNDVTAPNFLGNATTATTAGNITATSNTTLTSLSNLNTVGTITSGTWSGTTIAVANGGTGATTAAGARANLGLAIGTDVMSATATTTLTGDVTGSGNGSFATTLAASGVTSGTYGSSTAIPTFTVDSKGRLTAAGTVGITAGVSTLAYSSTSAANGGTISGTTLTLTAADGTNPGLISTGTQTIAGDKTFSSNISVRGVKIGIGQGDNTTNTVLGGAALVSNTSGSYNTAIGGSTLFKNTTGSHNIAAGQGALENSVNGTNNAAMGSNALFNNTSGNGNSAFGIGGLYTNTTGDNNTSIGYGADVLSGGLTNATAIGYNAKVNANNTIQLGNSSVTSVVTSGTISATGFTGPLTGNATTATTAGNITATSNTTLTSLSNLNTVGTITSGTWSGTTIAVANGGTGATTAAAARTNLGLAIGTDVMSATATTTLTGDVTGSGNGSFATTLAASGVTSGNYGSSTAIPTFTVDSKGRLTAAGTVGITAGVSTLAYSSTSAANGGTISGTTLTLAAADGTNPGLISIGSQTINGAKTFNNNVTAPNFLGNATTATTAGNITATSNTTLTSLSNLNTVGTITSGTWSGTTIAVSNGGTGLTSLTAGQIPFGNGTSALGASPNLFWDNTNTRLGVGTNTPTTKLDVNGSFKAAGLSYPTSDGTAGQYLKTDGSGNIGFTSLLVAPSYTTTNRDAGTFSNGALIFNSTSGNIQASVPDNATVVTNSISNSTGSASAWQPTYSGATQQNVYVQTFTTASAVNLTSITLNTYVNSSPATVIVKVFNDSDPSNGLTNEVGSISKDITSNSLSNMETYTLPSTYLTTANATYTFVVYGISSTNIFNVGTYGSNNYSGGSFFTSQANTSYNASSNLSSIGLTNFSGNDLKFNVNYSTGASASKWIDLLNTVNLTSNVSGSLPIANGGTGATTAADARTNLGLVIGTNVQAPLTAGSGISINAGTISATGLTTSNLASNAAITNAQLANSSTTLGSTTLPLGGIVTTVAGLTSVTSTGFTGALTGNASTATKLAATKNINGIAFDGSADITIAADANTLTGTTLASNVVNSSLTGVGTITSGVWSGTAIAIANGGTGQSTKAAAFNALSPMTTAGDIIYGGSSGTGTRLAKGTDGQVLTLASGVPSWASLSGITALAAIGSTANANGASISGSTLNLQPASASFGGIVNTTTQTFAGAKTFNADILTNGVRAGRGVAEIISNTVLGRNALGGTSVASNQNSFNTAVGTSAMQNADGTGSYNTAVGANSAFYNNSGSHNTYLGYQSGYYTTSGTKNVAIGSGALYGSTTGNFLSGAGNNAIGFEAMKDISTTAADNIAIGLSAGTKLTTGTKNIFIGSLAGSSISTGSTANTTGLNSVFIGYDVRPLANEDRNEIVISGFDGSAGTVGLGSNTTLIGSSTTTDARIMGALNLPNSTASTSSSSGALTVGGGAGIAGALNVGGATTLTGAATISNTTASTSSTTGALRVGGGVGIAGALNVGGNSVFAGTIEIDGGSPGAGKVLTSDANGLASWTYGGGTTSTKTGAYTILLTDKYVFYGSTASAAATFTLPAATGNDGKEIIIKNKSAFILTIQRSGSETIFQENSTGNSAASSITLGIESSNNWVKLVSDGTQWVVFRALF